jgi:hypothetical protein
VEVQSTVGGKLRLRDPWNRKMLEQATKLGQSLAFEKP